VTLSIGILVIDFAVMSGAGIGEAVELEEKESKLARIWRYFAYAWTVGRNILVLWLVYLAFGRMESVFQKLMLAGLVLILQSVSDSRTSILRSMIEEAYLHRKLFLGVNFQQLCLTPNLRSHRRSHWTDLLCRKRCERIANS
jgi:hypothetical protein